MSDDYSANVQTTGAVAVGGSATGSIETAHDQDWFAVELEAGRTYQFDLGGSPSEGGTLRDTFLRAIYDSEGRYQSDSYNDDFEGGRDSRVTFTARETGTYYVRASGDRDETGSYTLRVSDVTPVSVEDPPPVEPPAETVAPEEPGPARAAAEDLGDITELAAPRFPLGTLDGGGDAVAWYRFTLSEAREVALGLRRQDADADLVLEDAAGNVLHSSERSGTTNEWLRETLLAGTYYVRVEAQEAGANAYVFRYGVGDADPAEVTRLEAEQESVQEQVQQQPPAFGSQFYGFDLPENTDGSANRISLGTVSAVDPEGDTLTYSIEGGNAAGLFEIDAASGELFYTGGGEDYETGSTSFELTVRASDGDQTTDTTATVNVTDVDEPVEVDPPVAQPDQSTPQTVSEPAGEDFSAGASTSGRVAVGDTATGNVGSNGDRDWFAVELVAGRTYVIDLRGSRTDDGTLSDPYLGGIHDSDGNLIPRTTNDDGGQGYNSRVTFTATESGTHYIAAGAAGVFSGQGTYEVEVTDTSPPIVAPDPDSEDPPDTQEQVQQQPPAFGSQFYGFELPENTDGSANRISLGTVSATDPDGGSVTYSIEGGDAAGLFEIDAAGGELFYTGGGEDYETGSTSFELTVRASDGDQTTDTTVAVNVTDVDDPVEVDPPVAQPDQSTPQTVSEPAGEDFSAGTSTSGRVAVGDTATGNIGGSRDGDWFAVELVAGRTYVIDLRGSSTDDGTLSDPYLRGIHDSDGNLIPRTTNDDGGQGYNSRVTFTATESGTHYIAAGAYSGRGTYEVEVTDTPRTIEDDLPTTVEDDLPTTVEDDFAATVDTTGTVEVGGSATGEIEHPDDHDWFAVELEAGKTYQIDTGGVRTGGGTLPSGRLHGVYDADGNSIPNVFDRYRIYERPNNQRVRVDDDQVFFTPDEDGTYYVAASNGEFTSTGTYTVRVTEMEDDFPATVDTTGTVEVGGTATGEIEYETDWDWFAVELAAGQSYQIDLKGRSTNDSTSLYSPYLRGIYDAEGNQIPGTVDRHTGGGTSRVHFTAETDGTYYIAADSANTSLGTYEVRVWEDDFASYSWGTTGTVEVGGSATGEIQYAGDYDYFAVELEAGKTYQIDVGGRITGVGTLSHPHLALGYATGISDAIIIAGTYTLIDGQLTQIFAGEDEQAFFTADGDGTYYLAVSSFATRETGTYTVRVTEIEDDLPATVDTSGTVEVGGTATGELQYETDRDWFAVELTAGETYKVELLGARSIAGTLLDPYIRGIHDANGRLISDTTDYASGPHSNSQVYFTPDEDGTYYVAAGSYMSGYRDEDVGTYTVQVSIDDFRDDTDTTGTVEVGDSVTGEIEAQGDRDWFAVILEAGKRYQVDMEGSTTDSGTLANPLLYGMHDTDGNKIWGTWDRDGEGLNSRVTFTPDEDATYYVAAGSGGHSQAEDSHGRSLGTYTLSVEEVVDAI